MTKMPSSLVSQSPSVITDGRGMRRVALSFVILALWPILAAVKNAIYTVIPLGFDLYQLVTLVLGIANLAVVLGVAWAIWTITARPPIASATTKDSLRYAARIAMAVNVLASLIQFFLSRDPLNPPSQTMYMILLIMTAVCGMVYTVLLAMVMIHILRPLGQSSLCGQLWGLVIATSLQAVGTRVLAILPLYVEIKSTGGFGLSDLRAIDRLLTLVFQLWTIAIYLSAAYAIWRLAKDSRQPPREQPQV